MEIVSRTVKAKNCVYRWQQRFMKEGVDGLLYEATRPPGTPPVADWKVREVVELTLSPPDREAVHWTLRAMAKRVGLAVSTMLRIWQPHRVRKFKLLKDPAFVDKVRDISGLYVNPPEHAVVLSVDERSQIQALGRTQSPLQMKKGHPETRTHDYKRNGTTALFAYLNILDGTVIGQSMDRHRTQEFIDFLDTIAGQLPEGRDVHVILDNSSTHRTAEVHAWLNWLPRWTFQFTPTSSS